MRRTRRGAFYINIFLPWAKDNHVQTDPHLWYFGGGPPARNDFASATDRQGVYPALYEHHFDFRVLQSYVVKREFGKVRLGFKIAAERDLHTGEI